MSYKYGYFVGFFTYLKTALPIENVVLMNKIAIEYK